MQRSRQPVLIWLCALTVSGLGLACAPEIPHGGGSGDHGHAHAGEDDHGHAHGRAADEVEDDHGHAHVGEDDHGHAHGAAADEVEDDHGHAHAGEDDHGHPHGAAADETEDEAEDDHGHAHASEDDHGHAHGVAAGEAEDDHGHTHAGEDDHGHAHAGEDDHGHAHTADGGHGDDDHGASEVVTLWGETTQLFVEFPSLVAGEESAFAAHLTRLSDHLPIGEGTVVVELVGGGQTERFTASDPSRPGIFRPVVRPVTAGERRVTVELTSAFASERHDLGEFTVYGSRQAANRAGAHGAAEDPNEVSFLLEQQWPIDFRIEQIIDRSMRPNVPAFAHFDLPAGSENFATAPREGRIIAGESGMPQVGDVVEAGTTLFSVALVAENAADPAALDFAVDEAGIRVRSAQREVDRLTPLVAQGVVAQRRLDEASSVLASAQAESRSARRRRSSVGASQQVDSTADGLEVPSPLSGIVAEVRAVPGAWVSQGQEIVRIVDPTTLWLDVTVPEAYLAELEHVSGAWINLQGYDEPLEVGRDALISIGLEVDRDNRTLPVRFRVDNSDRRLFAGMTAQAHLVTDTPEPVPAVPMRAVVDDSGIDVVYVQTGGETFERRPVRLGIRDGAYVEVIGVQAGEWIATRGAYSVKIASASTESVGHGHSH